MSYKFNPFTGTLDIVNDASTTSSIEFKKSYKTADAAFLLTRLVSLSGPPLLNSEKVFFNGLLITDDCYTIVSNELTFDVLLDIRIGDLIDIRYAL